MTKGRLHKNVVYSLGHGRLNRSRITGRWISIDARDQPLKLKLDLSLDFGLEVSYASCQCSLTRISFGFQSPNAISSVAQLFL